MSIGTKPYTFSMITGRCHNCNKKLPKKLAYWCNASCMNKYMDKAIANQFITNTEFGLRPLKRD